MFIYAHDVNDVIPPNRRYPLGVIHPMVQQRRMADVITVSQIYNRKPILELHELVQEDEYDVKYSFASKVRNVRVR